MQILETKLIQAWKIPYKNYYNPFQKLTKVLMLGWEFPPVFNGGLGVATFGLVKALSKTTQIRLIVPNADMSADSQSLSVAGLNHITAEQLELERTRYPLSRLVDQLEKVPLTISPYHHVNVDLIRKKELLEEQVMVTSTMAATRDEAGDQRTKAAAQIRQFFSSKEIYGPHILQKTHLFAELADQLATPDNTFDVIHAHDWVTYPAGVRIKQRTGKPLVLHVHSLETDRSGDAARNEIYWLEKSALEKADRIIAVSNFTKERIIKHYGIDASRIHVVYNGIAPKEITRKPHKLKDKIVVFLGRITHQKGPSFLLETAEKVVAAYPSVKFVVAGTGDQFMHLLETTAYKKLGSKFLFTGFLTHDKVDQLLAMADVYFMPSVSEPFGLSALEAAQHLVPGVLSKQSGAGEVISDALKADFWDTDKHANYIYALLKYDVLHKTLAQKANEQLSSLTWETAAKKVNALYGELATRD